MKTKLEVLYIQVSLQHKLKWYDYLFDSLLLLARRRYFDDMFLASSISPFPTLELKPSRASNFTYKTISFKILVIKIENHHEVD